MHAHNITPIFLIWQFIERIKKMISLIREWMDILSRRGKIHKNKKRKPRAQYNNKTRKRVLDCATTVDGKVRSNETSHFSEIIHFFLMSLDDLASI